jgi:hypothetical protein
MDAAIETQRIDLLEKATRHLRSLPEVDDDWLRGYEARLKELREEQS